MASPIPKGRLVKGPHKPNNFRDCHLLLLYMFQFWPWRSLLPVHERFGFFFRVELLHWTSLKHWKSQPRPSQEGEKDNPLVSCCSTCYACADSQTGFGRSWMDLLMIMMIMMTRAGENQCSTKPTGNEDRNNTFNCSTHKQLARNATIDDWWQAEIPDSQVIWCHFFTSNRQRESEVLTDVAGESGATISIEQPCGPTCLGHADTLLKLWGFAWNFMIVQN